MPSSPPTPTQVQAHRFAVRRLEAALVGRDPTLRHDPGRRQQRALIAGALLGVLVLAGFAVVGLVRGDADWRHAAIVRGTPSGALYAVAHDPDRLVPALNLASARLLASVVTPPDPSDPPPAVTAVRDDALAAAARTPTAGIPGAPSVLPDPGAPVPDAWAVCDVAVLDDSVPDPAAAPILTTAVLGGVTDTGRPLGRDEALLLRGEDAFWLVSDGRRARITPQFGSVLRGLDVLAARPRPAGRALLDALPEAPPLLPVTVPGSGTTPADPRAAALGVPVGSVVSPDGARFFLVAAGGIQEVPAVVAQIARFANPDPAADPGVASVPAAVIDAAPRVAVVDVAAYPATFPRVVGYDDAGRGGTVACARPGGPATVAAALPVATTPLPGPGADAVAGAHVAGAGAFVVPTAPDGAPTTAGGVLVDPTGRAFPVPDTATAAALGLGAPRRAPASVIDLLPRGPVLDLGSATISR